MPSATSSNVSHMAQVALDFIVVGGSIAGTFTSFIVEPVTYLDFCRTSNCLRSPGSWAQCTRD
jgi:hypothetical protein